MFYQLNRVASTYDISVCDTCTSSGNYSIHHSRPSILRYWVSKISVFPLHELLMFIVYSFAIKSKLSLSSYSKAELNFFESQSPLYRPPLSSSQLRLGSFRTIPQTTPLTLRSRCGLSTLSSLSQSRERFSRYPTWLPQFSLLLDSPRLLLEHFRLRLTDSVRSKALQLAKRQKM